MVNQGWRISREISIPDIVAVVSMFAAVIISYGNLDKRVTVIEDWRSVQHERDANQDASLKISVQEIKTSIDDMRQDIKAMRSK